MYWYTTILTLMNICHDFLTSFQKRKHLHWLTTLWEFCKEGISVVSGSMLQQQNERLGIADLGTCTTAWLCLNWLMDLGGNKTIQNSHAINDDKLTMFNRAFGAAGFVFGGSQPWRKILWKDLSELWMWITKLPYAWMEKGAVDMSLWTQPLLARPQVLQTPNCQRLLIALEFERATPL